MTLWWGQNMKFRLPCQFQKFLFQTLCVFSQITDSKHIEQKFHSVAGVMPQGWDLGMLGSKTLAWAFAMALSTHNRCAPSTGTDTIGCPLVQASFSHYIFYIRRCWRKANVQTSMFFAAALMYGSIYTISQEARHFFWCYWTFRERN